MGTVLGSHENEFDMTPLAEFRMATYQQNWLLRILVVTSVFIVSTTRTTRLGIARTQRVDEALRVEFWDKRPMETRSAST